MATCYSGESAAISPLKVTSAAPVLSEDTIGKESLEAAEGKLLLVQLRKDYVSGLACCCVFGLPTRN